MLIRSWCGFPTSHEVVAPNACNSLKESNAMHSFAMHSFGARLTSEEGQEYGTRHDQQGF